MPIGNSKGGIVKPGFFPGLVPDPPVLGTASYGGATIGKVFFASPENGGNAPITNYVFTVRDTSTGATVSASGTVSPIYINGLTLGQTYTITAIAVNAYGSSEPSPASNSFTTENAGDAEFTTSGSYSWVAPSGVTSVSAVVVGGGGGSQGANAYKGSGGGGLGWASGISVTPGNSYTVIVGSGGYNGSTGGTSSVFGISANGGSPGGAGSNTSFGGGVAGTGDGGAGGSYSVGSVGTSRGGGNGGAGGGYGDWTYEPGGGGAGGYVGSGGEGGNAGFNPNYTNVNTPGTAGAGGGGAGANGGGGASGGGVGINGQGTDGQPSGNGGSGGEGGNVTPRTGGNYGGGGGGSGNSSPSTPSTGGSGAVRIIWGSGRAFPSTNAEPL